MTLGLLLRATRKDLRTLDSAEHQPTMKLMLALVSLAAVLHAAWATATDGSQADGNISVANSSVVGIPTTFLPSSPTLLTLDVDGNDVVTPIEWSEYVEKLLVSAVSMAVYVTDPHAETLMRDIVMFH